MRLTRRGWGGALAGLFLVAVGFLLQRPFLLVGGAVIGAGLLGWQARFVRALVRVFDDLSVEQYLDRDRTVTGRELPVTLSAELASPSPLFLQFESRLPVGTNIREADADRLVINPGDTVDRSIYHASWPHAGRTSFERLAVTAADPMGIFEATASAGPAPTVEVEPRGPRQVHVGAGGEPVIAAYGEHATRSRGGGLDPAELRPYLPGDAADRIDWNATARLAEPYVREFEVETDRQLVLVVDHRASMTVGPTGETKLDYAREVALSYLASARVLDDPVACVTVGDDGLTRMFAPEASRRHFARVRAHLASLESAADGDPTRTGRPEPAATLAERAGHLAGDPSPFATTLRRYAGPAGAVVQQVEGDPRHEAVRAAREHLRGPAWTVVLTDDRDTPSLRRTVRLARRGGGRVVVYLTPDVLFEPGGLGDLDTAYDRYVAFEDRRRTLMRLDRVEAYEVGPGDRVEAVLAAGRARRARSRGGT